MREKILFLAECGEAGLEVEQEELEGPDPGLPPLLLLHITRDLLPELT